MFIWIKYRLIIVLLILFCQCIVNIIILFAIINIIPKIIIFYKFIFYIFIFLLFIISIYNRIILDFLLFIKKNFNKIIFFLPFTPVISLILVINFIILSQFVLYISLLSFFKYFSKYGAILVNESSNWKILEFYRTRAFYIVYYNLLNKRGEGVDPKIFFSFFFKFITGYSLNSYNTILELYNIGIECYQEDYSKKKKIWILPIFLSLYYKKTKNLFENNHNCLKKSLDKKKIIISTHKITLNTKILQDFMSILNIIKYSNHWLFLNNAKSIYNDKSFLVGKNKLSYHYGIGNWGKKTLDSQEYVSSKIASSTKIGTTPIITNIKTQNFFSRIIDRECIKSKDRTDNIKKLIFGDDNSESSYKFKIIEFRKIIENIGNKNNMITFQSFCDIKSYPIEDVIGNYKDFKLTKQQSESLINEKELISEIDMFLISLSPQDKAMLKNFIKEKFLYMKDEDLYSLIVGDYDSKSYLNAFDHFNNNDNTD